MKRFTAVLAAVLLASFLVPAASMAADAFPSKPVTGMVPMAPGGSSDLMARALEKYWVKYSTQPMVIVNKPGGGGVVGTEADGPLQAGRLHPLSSATVRGTTSSCRPSRRCRMTRRRT